jgi:hypothetical protein
LYLLLPGTDSNTCIDVSGRLATATTTKHLTIFSSQSPTSIPLLLTPFE